MAVESTNFIDEMRNVYNMIGKATLAPDADMDFASKLQMVIRGYLMNGAGQLAGPQQQGQGGPPGMGGGGMGLSPSTPGGPPPGGMGMNPGGGGPVEMPNGDELRRILGGAVQ